MEIIHCPHCGIRVCATADGRCPSCRRPVAEEEATPCVDKAAIVDRPPRPSAPEESTSPYSGLAEKIRPHGSGALAEHLSKEPVLVVIRSNESYSTRGSFLKAVNLYRTAVTSLPFNVLLDGNIVAKLTEGERFETPIALGEHSLRVTNARAASRAVSFAIDRGQRVRFACNGKMTGLMMRRID